MLCLLSMLWTLRKYHKKLRASEWKPANKIFIKGFWMDVKWVTYVNQKNICLKIYSSRRISTIPLRKCVWIFRFSHFFVFIYEWSKSKEDFFSVNYVKICKVFVFKMWIGRHSQNMIEHAWIIPTIKKYIIKNQSWMHYFCAKKIKIIWTLNKIFFNYFENNNTSLLFQIFPCSNIVIQFHKLQK